MKKGNRILAALLALILLIMPVYTEVNAQDIPTQDVKQNPEVFGDVAESGVAGNESDKKTEEGQANTEEELKNTEEVYEQEQKDAAKDEEYSSVSNTQQSLEEKEQFEYIYVDKDLVYATEEENIVVSFSDKTKVIENAVLLYQSETTGKERECASSSILDGTALFAIPNDSQTDEQLIVTGIRYTKQGQERTSYFSEGEMARFSMSAKEASDMEEVKAYVTDAEGNTFETDNGGVEDVVLEAMELAGVEADAAEGVPGKGRSSAGKTVLALDPGHDMSHGGTASGSLIEYILSLKVANYCKSKLDNTGKFQILMTRTTNACPFPETTSSSSAVDIRKRVKKAKADGASAFISFHFNSGGGNGAEIIYQNEKGDKSLSEQSKDLADKIVKELAALGLKNRGTYSKTGDDGNDYFAVHDEAKAQGIPGIIIEHAFVDGATDSALLKDEAFLNKLGVADANGIEKYFDSSSGWTNDGKGWKYKRADGTYPINQWEHISGKWYYFDSKYYRVSGWQMISGKQYYFSSDGIMQTGWQKAGTPQYYYFGSDGVMQTGWQKIGDTTYYFYPTGGMLTGWLTLGGKTYYFYPTGGMVIGQATIDGKTYYFNSNGELENQKTGWVTENGKDYYYDKSGKKLAGWQVIDGKQYYLGADGAKRLGWDKAGTQQYYYFGTDGVMKTGFQKIGDTTYYFYSTGGMLTGWLTLGDKTYYFYPTGGMVTGKVTIDGKTYTFNSKGELEIVKSGWVTENGKDYYYDKSGKKLTGWQTIESKQYYLGTDGAKCVGWEKAGTSQYYYLGTDGVMRTGFQKIGDTTYYFYSTGGMLTGWLTLGDKTYYFYSTGGMATGKVTIDGKTYSFNSKGELENGKTGWVTENGKDYYYDKSGKKLTGWQMIDGKQYYLGSDGAKRVGWEKAGTQQYYYLGTDGVMQTGFQKIGDTTYYFYSTGGMLTGWLTLGDKTYYFYPTGGMVTGQVTIDGKSYFFNSKGELENRNVGWVTESGKDYYYDTSGKKLVGWQIIDSKQYYLGTDGAKCIGWEKAGTQQYYYLGTDGVMQTGWQKIGNTTYYFYPTGSMLTGWLTLGGKTYYFYPTGGLVTRIWITLGEDKYLFDAQGVLSYTLQGLSSVMGKTTANAVQMAALFKKYSKYPEFYTSGNEAKTIEEMCQIYIEEAAAEGVRAEVAFSQAMLETGWLTFKGDVKIEQYNFAGLGATGNGVPGIKFPSMRIGIRAQIQHLKAYGSTEALNNECVDERFKYVKRGCAPYVDWLGAKENPTGSGWAASAYYGYDLRKLMDQIK